MHQLRDFAKRFLFQYRYRLAFLFTLELLANVLVLSLSVILALAYTRLFGFGSAKGRALSELGWETDWPFQYWIGLLALGILLRLFFDFQKEKHRAILSERMIRRLQPLLFRQQLRIQAQSYEEKGPGRFLLRFSGDLSSVKQLVSAGILQFSGDLTLIIMGLGLIAYLDWRLGVLVFGSLCVIAFVVNGLYRQVGRVEEERRNRRSGMLSMVSRSLHGITTLKAFNQEQPFLHRFERRADHLETLGIKYAGWAAAAKSLIQAGVYLTILLALVAMAYLQGLSDAPDSGPLFLMLLILLSWRSALARLFRVGLVWKKGSISWRKMGRLLDFEQEHGLQQPLDKLPNHPLRLDTLGLKQGRYWIFRDLTAEVGPGSLLIFKGGAHSGKTALMKVLARLSTPTEGRLFLGDQAQQHIHPKAWRRRMSFVGTIFPLTGRTIFEAISYSRTAKHKISAAALLEEWQNLFAPLQSIHLEDRLGDDKRLSSTQVQLLMWMRALLSYKPIIIADEPWAGLDAPMQASLGEWLGKNRPAQAWIFLSKDAEVGRYLKGYTVQVLDLAYCQDEVVANQ